MQLKMWFLKGTEVSYIFQAIDDESITLHLEKTAFDLSGFDPCKGITVTVKEGLKLKVEERGEQP